MKQPSTVEQITEWLLRTRGMLPPTPLKYLGTRSAAGISITGVVVPSHADQPAQRIMLEDMGLAGHRPFAPPPIEERARPMSAIQELESNNANQSWAREGHFSREYR